MRIPAFVLSLLLCCSLRASADTLKWESPVTESKLDVEILQPEKTTAGAPLSLVIYLKNLSATQGGTEADASILRDLRAAGNLVAVVDYKKHAKARVPFLNRDLGKMRDDIRARSFIPEQKIDDAHVFIVPAGSRLLRDVVFYRESERNWAMDIIYPSNPAQPVGSIIEFSCDNAARMGNTSLSICSDTILDAQATEGFAVAMADHPVPAPYKGLDPMPDCARRIKAAVRTLRAQSEKLKLNGKIVPVGFSRGSGMALMLVTTANTTEFDAFGENQGMSSAVQGAVVMSGRFTYLDLLADDKMIPRYAKAWGTKEEKPEVWKQHGALDYLTDAAPYPLFLTINITEGAEALHQMKVLRKRLSDLGSDEIFMMDREPRGHKVTLVPGLLEAMNGYFKGRLN